MCQYLTDFHGKSQRFEIFATISSKYLNIIVYYLSLAYTSIITTESIVTICMNRRNVCVMIAVMDSLLIFAKILDDFANIQNNIMRKS